MSDRKWLNLVIFLISVMILLFLMIHKNMNREAPVIITMQPLVPITYSTTLLRINSRWIPVEQITTEIGQQHWLAFENAWKNLEPDSISTNQIQNPAVELQLTLVWVGKNKEQKLNFKLFATKRDLTIQILGKRAVNYHYPIDSAKQLLPVWLVEKIALQQAK